MSNELERARANQAYLPDPDSFSDFDGEAINRTWTLTVADAFVGDAVDCDCDGFVVDQRARARLTSGPW